MTDISVRSPIATVDLSSNGAVEVPDRDDEPDRHGALGVTANVGREPRCSMYGGMSRSVFRSGSLVLLGVSFIQVVSTYIAGTLENDPAVATGRPMCHTGELSSVTIRMYPTALTTTGPA